MKDNYSNKLKAFYYLVLTTLHFYMNYYLRTTFPNVPTIKRFLFLTNISFNLNWLYYTVKFFKETPIFSHLPLITEEKSLKRLLRFNFALSFVVVLMYWIMKLSNPKLLFSDPKDIIPLDLDLFLHGANLGFNFLEHLVIKPEFEYENSYKSFFLFLVFYSSLLKIAQIGFGINAYAFVFEKGMMFYLAVVTAAMLFMILGDFLFIGIKILNGKRFKIKESK